MSQFPKKLKIFVIIITLLSILLGIYLFRYSDLITLETLLLFTILSIIAESLLITMPNGAAVSVGFAISLASVIVGGPFTAYIVNGMGVLLRYVKIPKRGSFHILNTPLYKSLFNFSQCSIAAGISGLLYILVGGKVGSLDITNQILPVTIIILSYLTLNTLLLSNLLSILNGGNVIKMWMNNIKGTMFSSLIIGFLGVVIAFAYIKFNAFGIIILFAPLLLARYSYKLYMDMRSTYMETVNALTNSLEAKDPYTKGHASRVQHYALLLAQELELSDQKIENIKTAAILHDIGKIGIKDDILNKPGKLNDYEFGEIKKHPTIGANILQDVHFLNDVTKIVRHHHERHDGNGYPDGLKGNEIPAEAAILSIADVYDAMTSDRPYRKALCVDVALAELIKCSGTQFHPEFAKIFITIVEKEKVGALNV